VHFFRDRKSLRDHGDAAARLNDNQYIKENAQLKLLDSAPEDMGSEFEAIQLVLNNAFELLKLVQALVEWRNKSRETAAPIVVQSKSGPRVIRQAGFGFIWSL
jgi:hypothetical protein